MPCLDDRGRGRLLFGYAQTRRGDVVAVFASRGVVALIGQVGSCSMFVLRGRCSLELGVAPGGWIEMRIIDAAATAFAPWKTATDVRTTNTVDIMEQTIKAQGAGRKPVMCVTLKVSLQTQLPGQGACGRLDTITAVDHLPYHTSSSYPKADVMNPSPVPSCVIKARGMRMVHGSGTNMQHASKPGL